MLPPEECVTDSKQDDKAKAGFDAKDLDPYYKILEAAGQ